MAIRMDPNELWQRSQGVINQAVGRGTEMLAERIEHYSGVAGDVSERLREKGEPQAADFVDMIATGIGDAAGYLRQHDGAALWSDAQAFARGRTWLLSGIGFVGGIAAARAIRSANDARDWQRQEYVESYAQAPPRFGESSSDGMRYSEEL